MRARAGRRTPADGEHQQRLRRQRGHAVRRAAAGRDPDDALRRDQEGGRIDGAQLCPPVGPADHDVPLLHGLRAVGPARHGAVQVHPRDHRRRADRHLQRRRDVPRFHLRQRPCARHPAADRRGPGAARVAPPRSSRATASARWRRSAWSTSATATRSSCSISSTRSRPSAAFRPSATTWKCRRATCPRPGPMPTCSSA